MAGRTVLIETVPHDPRSLFYGDYVDLNLAISHVDRKKVDPALARHKPNVFSQNLPVYVSLVPKGRIYTVQRVSLHKPTQGLFLKGSTDPYDQEGEYVITYPMQKFYVQERTGQQLEHWAEQGRLLVQLKVYDGYAIITGVKKDSTH